MRRKTRYSLYYLATYLSLTGVGFMAAPAWTLKLLFSNRSYDPVFVRFVGAFMIGLSTVIVQVIRYRLEQLYPTTIVVRLFFIASIIGFYFETRDPAFLMMLGVVAVGVTLTSAALFSDRRPSDLNKQPQKPRVTA